MELCLPEQLAQLVAQVQEETGHDWAALLQRGADHVEADPGSADGVQRARYLLEEALGERWIFTTELVDVRYEIGALAEEVWKLEEAVLGQRPSEPPSAVRLDELPARRRITVPLTPELTQLAGSTAADVSGHAPLLVLLCYGIAATQVAGLTDAEVMGIVNQARGRASSVKFELFAARKEKERLILRRNGLRGLLESMRRHRELMDRGRDR